MKYKIIGLYELITGIFGVLLLLFSIGQVINNEGSVPTFILGIILYAGTGYAGYALLNNLRNARKYSIISQVLQSVSFVGGGVKYLFTASAFIFLEYKNHDLNLEFQIAPIAYKIAKVADFIPFEIVIYVVPVVFAALLIIKD